MLLFLFGEFSSGFLSFALHHYGFMAVEEDGGEFSNYWGFGMVHSLSGINSKKTISIVGNKY